MPTARTDGVALYYETADNGKPVVFVEDVGLGAWMWGWQHAALAGPFRTVVWDLRRTGRSGLATDRRATGNATANRTGTDDSGGADDGDINSNDNDDGGRVRGGIDAQDRQRRPGRTRSVRSWTISKRCVRTPASIEHTSSVPVSAG